MFQPIVLIISGNQPQTNLVYNHLKEAGFQVFKTNQGERIAEMLVQLHPQLVLMDWDLPNRSALTMIRAIRRQPGFTRVPIILTGREISSDDRILSLESGVDFCLEGTVPPQELTARMKALLRRIDDSNRSYRA